MLRGRAEAQTIRVAWVEVGLSDVGTAAFFHRFNLAAISGLEALYILRDCLWSSVPPWEPRPWGAWPRLAPPLPQLRGLRSAPPIPPSTSTF